MPPVSRALGLTVAGLLLLEGLIILLAPNGPLSEPAPHTFDVEIPEAGSMVPTAVAVERGDRVILRISSARAVRLHLHGYDLARELGPELGTPLSFDADRIGSFAIEDDRTGARLGSLVVRPR